MKNKAAQEMVALRNKKYGPEWVKKNAQKAGLGNRKASHSGSLANNSSILKK